MLKRRQLAKKKREEQLLAAFVLSVLRFCRFAAVNRVACVSEGDVLPLALKYGADEQALNPEEFVIAFCCGTALASIAVSSLA